MWAALSRYDHELTSIENDLTPSKVKEFLDCDAIIRMLGVTYPSSESALFDILEKNRIVNIQPDGQYGITRLGAILFARDLRNSRWTMRNTVRIVQYDGNGRTNIIRQVERVEGYAIQFDDTIDRLSLLLPTHQKIVNGIMVTIDHYPMEVIREILTNAMIHQNFSGNPMYITVEIFDNRVEITNPGGLMVDRLRIIDWPSDIRNKELCAFMRRMGFCEEVGSGWDRIVESCEAKFLPVPHIQAESEFTRVTIFGRIPFDDMTKEDRIWACYAHACILHAAGRRMTNASFRSRFNLDGKYSVVVSRLFKSVSESGLIRVFDNTVNPRNLSYVPFWSRFYPLHFHFLLTALIL